MLHRSPILAGETVAAHRELDGQGALRVAKPDRVEVLLVEPLALIVEALTADEDGGPSRQPPQTDERFLHLERDVFALPERAGEPTPLEPGAESVKVYCPGIGLVIDNAVRLVRITRQP